MISNNGNSVSEICYDSFGTQYSVGKVRRRCVRAALHYGNQLITVCLFEFSEKTFLVHSFFYEHMANPAHEGFCRKK